MTAPENSAGLRAVAEAAMTHPDVADAVAVIRPAPAGSEQLVAYVVPAAESRRLTATRLRTHLAGALPDFAVPDVVVLLEKLPLTGAGEPDLAALPAPGAARTGSEELLCALFASVLNVPDVGLDDDFFDLGGHSLHVTRLVGKIRSVLGTDVPVLDVFDCPTARALAAFVDDHAGPARHVLAPVVRLRAADTGLPLFLVHPITGVCLAYAGLLPYLGTRQPVYGLQATPSRPTTMADLADEYTSRIRAVQPAGPYQLAGWSMGGLIAQSIATRLQADGEKVSLLALIDAYPVPDRRHITGETDDSEQAALAALSAGLGADGRPVTHLLSESLEIPHAEAAALVNTAIHHSRLAYAHIPKIFTGRMLLFSASDGASAALSPGIWHRYVDGSLVAHRVPGDHHSLLRHPAAQHIAELIAGALR